MPSAAREAVLASLAAAEPAVTLAPDDERANLTATVLVDVDLTRHAGGVSEALRPLAAICSIVSAGAAAASPFGVPFSVKVQVDRYRISYDAGADCAYVGLLETRSEFLKTRVTEEGMPIDIGSDGSVRGYEVLLLRTNGWTRYPDLPMDSQSIIEMIFHACNPEGFSGRFRSASQP